MNDVGDVEKLEILELKNDEGDLVDPGTLTLEIQKPSGAVTTHKFGEGEEIVRVSEGSYFFRLVFEESGVWIYRWKASEGVELAESGAIPVGVDPFNPFPDEDFTVAEVWGRSQYLRQRYPRGNGDGDLSQLVAIAAPLVGSLTGREIAGIEGEEVPASMKEIALAVIGMKAEQLANSRGSFRERKGSVGSSNLRGFRAGSYAEDYFGLGDAATAKKLDADPILAELLWALCTDAKKEEWLELWDPEHYTTPAYGIRSYDWNQRPGGY